MQGFRSVYLVVLFFVLIILQQWVSAVFTMNEFGTKVVSVKEEELRVKFIGVGKPKDYVHELSRGMTFKVGESCKFNIFGNIDGNQIHYHYTDQPHPVQDDTDVANPTGFTIKGNTIVAEGSTTEQYKKCSLINFKKSSDNKYKIKIGYLDNTLELKDFALEIDGEETTEDLDSGAASDSHVSYWITVGLPLFLLLLLILCIVVSIIVYCVLKKRRERRHSSYVISQQTIVQEETNKTTDQQMQDNKSKEHDVEEQKDVTKEEKDQKKDVQVSQYTTIDGKNEALGHEHTGQHNSKFCNECFMLKPNRVMSVIED